MPRYVAFLRAINVGGRVVKMDQLRRIFGKLGFTDVETFIASGNVIFRSKAGNRQALEKRIEAGLGKALGYEVATLVRTDAEVASIVTHEAFSKAELAAASWLVVGLLSAAPGPANIKALLALRTDKDDFAVHGTEVYWLLRHNQSDSTLANGTFEKSLKVRATFRGMKTMVKLAAKYPPA